MPRSENLRRTVLRSSGMLPSSSGESALISHKEGKG